MSLWKRYTDFKDFDWTNQFMKFETVLTQPQIKANIVGAVSPWTVSDLFCEQLATNIYGYCYGKQICLLDSMRWRMNFLGEIGTYLMQEGRYLQAMDRDVNLNIANKGGETVTETGESMTGTADNRKNGGISNMQEASTEATDSQGMTNELGDTLTILNHQTTSTNYLASKNDESFSRGDISQNTGTSLSKGDTTNINFAMENGESLSDTKDTRKTVTERDYSPLEIAKIESEFNWRDWFEPLFDIIDTYFIAGGNGEYA